jgi:uncharacterized protein with HEPN domain
LRTVRDRLEDVLEAIHRIEQERNHGRATFDSDAKTQVWMIHHIRIIGEAVRSVSDQLKKLDPETPWAQIVGMRHILVHDYFGIDLEEVWAAVVNDLPPLKQAVERLLSELPGDV